MATHKKFIGAGIALGSIFAALIGAELLLRVALFAPFLSRFPVIRELRNPDHFARHRDDSAFWILFQLWNRRWFPDAAHIHGRLGWSQTKVSPDNPLGLFPSARDELRSPKPKIMVFGDSFIKGAADGEFTIPRLLGKALPDRDFVDLSVGGYGLDQIYLMMEESRSLADPKGLIVGVLPDDLNRSIMSARTYQKPFFTLSDGKLKLDPKPIEREPSVYLRKASPEIGSYLLAYLFRKVLPEGFTTFGPNADYTGLKKTINAKLIEAIDLHARERGASLLFVLFYECFQLQRTIWEAEFLIPLLRERNLAFVDTKPLLSQHATAHALPQCTHYQGGNGHHNNLGNQVIASGIRNHFLSRAVP